MSLFRRQKNVQKEKGPEGKKEDVREEKESENKETENKELEGKKEDVNDAMFEQPNPDFFMVIQQVVELGELGCRVVGQVADAPVHKYDPVIIRKNDGTKIKTRIEQIDLDGQYQIAAAKPGMAVGIKLEGIEKDQVAGGDRIVSALAEDVEDIVKDADALYVLFDKVTNLPFTGMHCAEVYTKEEYAAKAVEHYEKVYKDLQIKEIPKAGSYVTAGIPLFGYFYYLGLEEVLVDNGVKGIMIRRGEILPPPDWTGIPEVKIPVVNPELRFRLNCYMTEVRSGITYEGQKEMLKRQEAGALAAIKNARFLVPMQSSGEITKGENEVTLKKGATLTIAVMTNKEGQRFQPLFTDWLEFQKAYDKKNWKGMICSFENAVALGYRNDGMVINPLGENMAFDKKTMEKVFKEYVEK